MESIWRRLKVSPESLAHCQRASRVCLGKVPVQAGFSSPESFFQGITLWNGIAEWPLSGERRDDEAAAWILLCLPSFIVFPWGCQITNEANLAIQLTLKTNSDIHVFAYESVTDYKQCNIWTRGAKRSVVCRQKQAQISELLNFAHFKNLFIINYGHCYWDTR